MSNDQESRTHRKKPGTTWVVLGWLCLGGMLGFNVLWVSERCGIMPRLGCTQCTNLDETLFQSIIGFYEMLVTFQFGIIGVLLVVCFLYTQHVSKKHAEEIVEEAMASERMQERISRLFLPVVEKITKTEGKEFLISLLDEKGIEDMLEKLANYEEKMKELDTIVRALANSGRKSSGKKLSVQSRKEVTDGNNS
jgi:hypothetical protein